MRIKINWLNENPGAAADERGYWRSTEGRFGISPRYRHTIYPDSYLLTDRLGPNQQTYDTVREAKAAALNIVTGEVANEIGLDHIKTDKPDTRNADRIDGYDRDDLGESPDY